MKKRDQILQDVYLLMLNVRSKSFNQVFEEFSSKYPDSHEDILWAYQKLTRSTLTGSSFDNFDSQYAMCVVPYFPNLLEEKTDEDIYIISLRLFKKYWRTGITFQHYLHKIRNVYGIDIDDSNLVRIYNEITSSNVPPGEAGAWGPVHYATVESTFRLLEYIELQESFKQSKSARWWAVAAMAVSIIGLLLTILFSIIQIKISKQQLSSDPKIDSEQFAEIKTLAKQDHIQLEKIANILSDTLKVKVQTKFKNKNK